MNKNQLEEYFQNKHSKIISDFFEFLRFKSVSADPDHTEDCTACASWLADKLKKIGFDTEIIATAGKPLVFATFKGSADRSLLYYGHYDVQPVDPIDLWESAPFEPEIRENKVFARGAVDNKGQTLYFLAALEALIEAGALDAQVSVLIEGEEEVGSPNLLRWVQDNPDRLKADTLLVCDTGCFREGLPTITMGLRGIISLEARLSGPNRDLHSGLNGGLCKNPAIEMSKIIAGFFDSKGKINIDGYYEGVCEPSAEELKTMQALNFSEAEYVKENGFPPNGGEQGLDPLVRLGFRPTLEVNGLYSGHTGAGGKTIIPAKATVKLTSRIAGKQEPEKCLAMLKKHIREAVPAGFELEFCHEEVGGTAFFMSASTEVVKKAKALLEDLFAVEPALVWEGASIPVVASLAECTGGEALLVGFALASDNLHAPNECFGLDRLQQGFLYAASVLQRI